MTPEAIQQMIVSALSAMGLSGKPLMQSAPWYFDSGASQHMTNNVDMLTNINKYHGNQKIHTADGNSLPIMASGDVSSSITDVLVSPKLSTNLVSVGQLVDNNCKVEFSKSGCLVQDQHSGRMIARGPKEGRLFPIHFPFSPQLSQPIICNSAFVDHHAWHKRLGHPNNNVLRVLLQSGSLGNKGSSSLNNIDFDCHSSKLAAKAKPCHFLLTKQLLLNLSS